MKSFSSGIFIILIIVLAVFLHTAESIEKPSDDIRDFYLKRVSQHQSLDSYPSVSWDRRNFITDEEEAKMKSIIVTYMKEKDSYDLNKNIWISAGKGAVRGAVLGALYEGAGGAMVGGMVWFAVGGIMRAMEAQ